ncbi:MAG TPA: TraB/GumN family protein [Syntrophobacteria bacterium]|nr:TraB/GumN family protein [Syntrophobacteria bacterium]
MKRHLLRASLALLVILVAGEVRAESSVWVLTSPTSTVYLAGSFHILRSSDYPLPPEFDAAYQRSARIVFEVSPAEMEKPEVQARLARMAVYDDGRTLQQHLTPLAYGQVEAFCRERGYPLTQFQSLRPWMLAMTLMILEMQRLGLQPMPGVDEFFDSKARQDGKGIEGLETVDEQIEFMTLLDKGMDDEVVIQTVAELQQLNTKLAAFVNAWRTGDEQGLEKLLLQELKEYPRLYRVLIVERNQRWLKRIEGYLTQPTRVMVIVGAAHLAGGDGLLEGLRKHGYTVSKLKIGQ